jgi:hypothetical protein
VLVWYPLANWFELRGDGRAVFIVMAVAVALGTLGSFLGEWRVQRAPRLKSGNTRLAGQCVSLVWIFMGSASLLSAVLPFAHPGAGRFVPHVWGFSYAFMAMTLGIVYSREFFWSGLAIFGAAVAAIFLLPYWGFILGVAMGLGILVPGLLAERRVSRLQRDELHVEA